MTYTFATLEVSQLAYDEIRSKLLEAGYDQAVLRDRDVELLDMRGIALNRGPEVSWRAVMPANGTRKPRT